MIFGGFKGLFGILGEDGGGNEEMEGLVWEPGGVMSHSWRTGVRAC